MPRQCSAIHADKQLKRSVETAQDLLRSQNTCASGGKLDCEGQAIQSSADPRNGRRRVFGQRNWW
jgi:hypothetical protein